MRTICLRLVSIIIYIGALLVLLGINIQKIFSLKLFILIGLGTLVLFLPYYSKELERKQISNILGRKALEAGYIQTFVLLFVCLSQQVSMENLFENIALNCRPLLYGYCMYILLETEELYMKPKRLKVEETRQAQGNQGVCEKNKIAQQVELQVVTRTASQRNDESDTMATQMHEQLMRRGLTKREIEIAKAILKGMSNREIAESFYVSEATVKKHISHIFEKLGIQKRDEIKMVISESLELKDIM